MATRQNITVDPMAPRTATDRCARAILTALRGVGWVNAADVDRTITAAGADVRRKGDAVKGLRNMGYPLAAVRARHLSRYRLYADASEMDDWRERTLRDAYSQQLTTARSLAGAVAAASPHDPALISAHAAAEGATITTGRALGIPLAQIVADLVPIP